MDTSNFGINQSIGSQINIETGAGTKDQLVGFYRNFKSELANLMVMLTDDEMDLELGGQKISAETKNGAAGTYLVNSWLDEQNNVLSLLLDAYKYQQTLEKQLNNISFS
jgi:hypothetical protein